MNVRNVLSWKKLISWFFILSTFILANFQPLRSVAAPSQGEDSPYSKKGFRLEDIPDSVFDNFEIESVPAGTQNPKLDPVLADLVSVASISPQKAQSAAIENSMMLLEGRLKVHIVTDEKMLDTTLKNIEEFGGEVAIISHDKTLLQAWLPLYSIEPLTQAENIYYIQRPDILYQDEVTSLNIDQIGSSLAEGLQAMNGDAWHNAGYQGQSIKIAIIDVGGFVGYKSLLGTDLPSYVTVKNFVDGETDAQVDEGNVHGTACAEIVYDVAPQSQLYLIKAKNNLEIQNAVDWLISQNVDIISASFTGFISAPGDGTGFMSDLIQEARDAGILWVNSSGNYRDRHWGGSYRAGSQENAHYWANDIFINFIGQGERLFSIPSGNDIVAYLRWDDWTAVNQDYDLYLVSFDGNNLDTVQKSSRSQTGSPGQYPTEYISYKTTGAPAYYGFIIIRENSSRNVNFEFFSPNAPVTEIVFARSLGIGADAPAALTVGAQDFTPPFIQHDYSSEGPTNGPGGTATGGSIKPDIAAFAGVTTQSYYPDPFKGTSASTPYVAGAAALVLCAHPEFGPDQIQNFLQDRAIDMGYPGKDNAYGYGRLYLGEPPSSGEMTLTVNKAGNGFGTVTSDPAGIDCGSTCSAAFTPGCNVTLTATPWEGSTFSGWSGACSGTSPTCVVTMTQTLNVTATFTSTAATTFADVPANHWAYSWIDKLYNAGITSGCATNPLRYCPENQVTRAEMAKFLLKGIYGQAYEPPALQQGESTGFNDVPWNHWAARWIKKLALDGITSGCGPGVYCPEQKVNRAEMAKFLLKAKYGAAYEPNTTGTQNLIQDPSFEEYTPNPYWTEYSYNFGTPLCTVDVCGDGAGTAGPHTGEVWAWFGGTYNSDEEGHVIQNVVIPVGANTLEFYFWIGAATTSSSPNDIFTVSIGNQEIFSANGTQTDIYPGYTLITLDINQFADGQVHPLKFYSHISRQLTNFNLDDVAIYGSGITTPTFTDVPLDFWASQWIEKLYQEGITSGCGYGNYCPNNPVSRAEMAKFLTITFNLP